MSSLRLILMRHAKAEPASGVGDHARPLSPRGRAEAAEVGRRLAGLIRPDLVLSSDSLRTRETFASLEPAFTPGLAHRFTRTLYDVTAETILAEIRTTPGDIGSLMVIGHNPGIGDLARRLAGGGDPVRLATLADGFPTSCFALLTFDVAGWADVAAPGRLDVLFPADERAGP